VNTLPQLVAAVTAAQQEAGLLPALFSVVLPVTGRKL